MSVFGVPWEKLKLEDVEHFLAGAGREPLTWEAKGTELRSEHVTRHVCGFANAVEGGYLLLGFELVDEQWRATGCDFPGDDPPVWISNVVRMTLRPRPLVDVLSWEINGKRVAVVRVDPVAEPPCVTTGGQLYQRVSGETIPVGDPADVRALYERGRAAIARAEALALRAIDAVNLGETRPAPEGASLFLGLALAPVGTARDIAARVFAPGMDVELRAAIDAMPHEPVVFEDGHAPRASTARVTQDAIAVSTTAALAHAWHLRVAWDGSVAGLLRVYISAGPGVEQFLADSIFEHAVRPMADVVENTARYIGGHGRAQVVLRILASDVALIHGGYTRNLPAMEAVRPIQRWADGEPWLDDALLESMKRELLRACGIPEWEPDHDG